ncbi:MAG: glycosyltransferase [Pedosphaera sp.]|nr:glycosyltransferase [Pedosphaera sp.]
MEQVSVRLADVVVSPSQYLLRWMHEQKWTLPSHTYVEQYVRPATARRPRPTKDGRVCHPREFVFFGRLEYRKGLVLFCDALDKLSKEPALTGYMITFLGKSVDLNGKPATEYVADRAKKWPWRHEVISDRDQSGAMDYLQGGARLVVLPSLVDNLPNTVLECLGAALPFIASNVGGIPEMIAPEDLDATCFDLRSGALAEKLKHVAIHGLKPARQAGSSAATERAWVTWHETQVLGLIPSTVLQAVSAAHPLVSVCMAHWNRPHYLAQAVASIEAQDYPNFEVVIVDDCSTSPEAVAYLVELEQRFKPRGWQVLRQPENKFPGAARNRAAHAARGEYIFFMDDDNVAKPGEITTFVNVARRTGADVLTCFLDTFDGQHAPGPNHKVNSRLLFLGDCVASGVLRNVFGDTNSLVRRQTFLDLGGFHEEWGVNHEDYEFMAKAVLRGYQLEVIPEALVWYRVNQGETSVLRSTPQHGNLMCSIRPFVDAVPPSLRRVIHLAQGQFMTSIETGRRLRYLEEKANRNSAETPYAQATIQWRSAFTAGQRVLARQLPELARELLIEAVNTATCSKDSQVILEALLEIVPALGQLDLGRAKFLKELAIKLAQSLRKPAELELARQLLNAVPVLRASDSTPTAHPPLAIAAKDQSPPRLAAIGATDVPHKRVAGFLSSEPSDYACPTLRLKSVLEHLHATDAVELLLLGAVRDGKFQIQESNLERAEIVVVQRQMAAMLPFTELRKRLNGRPAKIVFEIDDALTLLPEWHRASAAFRQIQPQIEEYLRRADLVTVSTPQLQSLYAPLNRNIVVLPNSVDTRLWSPPANSPETSDKVTILFSGTLDHERDLQVVEPALLDLIAAFPDQVEFLYWGNITERLRGLRQVKSVGAFLPSYRKYAAQLQKLPVSFAIVPLEGTAFNSAKSAIKWLEYSTCRIPGIYSDLAAYNQTVVHGQTGLLVPNNHDGWFNAMKTLVEDRALRHALATRAQAAVLARHTVAHNARLWLGAYESLFAPPMAQASPAAATAPTVSIVIPTFNKLELTRQCLLAVHKITSDGQFEIVVVDNGSTDGTADFLKAEEAAGRLRAILNSENMGFARACNQGAKVAQGKYVLLLNNDTEVQPGWLTPLVSLADSDAGIAGVGSKLLFPDRSIQHAGVAVGEMVGRDPLLAVHTFYKAPGDLPEANQRRVYQALTAACLMVRKSAFEAVGGFDEGFWNGYEDVDLCLRFQERGWLSVYEPASVVIHHESQSGPARFQKVQENIRRLHTKWLGKAKLDVVVAADGTVTQATTTRIRPYEPGSIGVTDTSILILTYNQLAHTKACLESILRHTPEPYELILVDNGSTDGTPEYLREYAAQHERVGVIANQTNRGFAAGNNQGLALATGRQVLLLNNDTVVTPGWLGNMLKVLRAHPQAGVVGPRSNRVLGKQQVDEVGYKSLDELPAFAETWGNKHAGQSRVASRVVGFCLLARREVIESVGGLDEQFGSGNFEDDDFCIRAHLAGFETRIADDSFVHHVGNATFTGAGIDYSKAMQTNWGLFKRKWAIPPETPPFPGYLTPDVAPPGVALKFPLPDLKLTHQLSAEGRCWMDKLMSAADKAKPVTLPPCALQGDLSEARQFLQHKKLPAAWDATRAALKHRPFHPEAYLLLAEIAQAAHDPGAARNCAEFARQIAPEFRAAKKFLKGKFYGHAKHDWLVLPEEIGKHKSERRHHLSVCLIVKNEENFLGQCLNSVKGLAHQIVVVDTGSTDRTIEIAREHGAEVHTFDWCDDFGAARNAALAHATGDWVLSLDADEELSAESRKAILKDIHNAGVIAYRLPIVDEGREADGCHFVPRLFRNAPGVHFAGRVHEHPFGSLETLRRPWGLDNRLGTARLLHHGYQSDVTLSRDKIARNRRLLELAVTESPDDPNLLMNLGLELVRSGDVTLGIERYRSAFDVLSTMPPPDVSPELREALLTQLSTHLLGQHRAHEVVVILQSPLARDGGLTASLHFLLGLAFMELKQDESAAQQMRQCITKRHQPTLTPINADIRKAGPQHCLGRCLAASKQFRPAEAAYEAALKDEPGARRVRLDMARLHLAQDRVADALKLLHELVSEKGDDADVWLCGGEAALSNPAFLEFARDWTGEAVKHVPQHNGILGQRAEALLLSGDIKDASAIWKSLASAGDPSAMAALVLCETARKGKMEAQVPQGSEKAASQEFLKWYRKLIGAEAVTVVTALNDGVQRFAPILPTAAGALTAVLSEAGESKEQVK